jgi:hypothetical protein
VPGLGRHRGAAQVGIDHQLWHPAGFAAQLQDSGTVALRSAPAVLLLSLLAQLPQHLPGSSHKVQDLQRAQRRTDQRITATARQLQPDGLLEQFHQQLQHHAVRDAGRTACGCVRVLGGQVHSAIEGQESGHPTSEAGFHNAGLVQHLQHFFLSWSAPQVRLT